ncbi:MAG: hypothetical protein ABMA64_04390 [Myxococcota bacterium]
MLLLAGCNQEELTWVAFNADDQVLTIQVLPEGSPTGEAVSLDLLSNLGRTVVGSATVDPGSGPIGTSHLLTVDVLDEFEALVGRASVEVVSEAVTDLDGDGEPDPRDNDGYDLRQDSADPGAYAITLQSLGDADEAREDEFVLHLWTAEELSSTPTGTTE